MAWARRRTAASGWATIVLRPRSATRPWYPPGADRPSQAKSPGRDVFPGTRNRRVQGWLVPGRAADGRKLVGFGSSEQLSTSNGQAGTQPIAKVVVFGSLEQHAAQNRPLSPT